MRFQVIDNYVQFNMFNTEITIELGINIQRVKKLNICACRHIIIHTSTINTDPYDMANEHPMSEMIHECQLHQTFSPHAK